jgi:hypothetical protein
MRKMPVKRKTVHSLKSDQGLLLNKKFDHISNAIEYQKFLSTTVTNENRSASRLTHPRP